LTTDLGRRAGRKPARRCRTRDGAGAIHALRIDSIEQSFAVPLLYSVRDNGGTTRRPRDALLQLAGNDAIAVQANGDQAVLDRMRQFMTTQLVEKLPQYDVFVDIATIPYSFDVGSWQNKVKADAAGQVIACTVTWAGAPGVLPGAAAKFGVGAVVNYFSKATPQPEPTEPGTTTGGGERDVPGRRHAGREPEHADRELGQREGARGGDGERQTVEDRFAPGRHLQEDLLRARRVGRRNGRRLQRRHRNPELAARLSSRVLPIIATPPGVAVRIGTQHRCARRHPRRRPPQLDGQPSLGAPRCDIASGGANVAAASCVRAA
jgi:hypothetical protein